MLWAIFIFVLCAVLAVLVVGHWNLVKAFRRLEVNFVTLDRLVGQHFAEHRGAPPKPKAKKK